MRIATGAYADPDPGLDFDADFDADFDFDFESGLDAGPAADLDAEPDRGLIGFEESTGSIPAIAGCGCPNCAARPRTARTATAGGGSRIHRAVRTTCLATTVLAGAGVVGLTAGAGAAHAAPGKQGWDGSKYWFRNSSGEWRWTGHYDVYLSRTGRSGGSAGTAGTGGSAGKTATASKVPAASSGIRQGWDGSKYWFRNGAGEWRWTSHYDVYLSRTGRSDDGEAPSRPAAASSTDDEQGSGSVAAAVDYALAQLGKPYVWGGDGPSGFDCSGLVQQAFRRSGISLPRVADDQYAATTPISAGQLRRGDLVFWSDTGRASGIHHVGIYLGGGTFVEAPRPGRTVRIAALDPGYYPTHFGRP
ncbi:C40 family peptidase [Kitasatospora sp. NPDC004745]|uniref:C40 family peptidase n=1 Tax=Kitasatospora sp. NPDC004745 TaxID=3364019 RepID=UPI0036AE3AA0